MWKKALGNICWSVRRIPIRRPCWRPLPGTSPYLGKVGELCTAPELKVEVTCRTDALERTIAAVKKVHPYEEPVINAIPLLATGLGE